MENDALEFQVKEFLSEEEKGAIMRLWNQEYPATLGYSCLADFNSYTSELVNPTHILVISRSQVFGWATKFDRNEERWFAIILSSSIHRRNIGSTLLHKLKADETELSGWVIDHDLEAKADGSPYPSPLGFYLKNGFDVVSDERLELPNLSAVKVRWRH